jgi:site-specific recombinase XerD
MGYKRARINFYLKDTPDKEGLHSIYGQITCNTEKLRFSLPNIKISRQQWQPLKNKVEGSKKRKKQREEKVYHNYILSPDGSKTKRVLENDTLLKYLEAFNAIDLNNRKEDKSLPFEVMKEMLFASVNNEPYVKAQVSSAPNSIEHGIFVPIFKKFINISKSQKAANTIRGYNTVLKNIEKFEESQVQSLSFEDINLRFKDEFIQFMTAQKYEKNYIAKNIAVIKTFMNWAADNSYHSNYEFKNKKFVFREKAKEIIHLTLDEVLQIMDFEYKKEHLTNAKHMFCFMCFTGLRFSDASELRYENIESIKNENDEYSYYLKMVHQKTKVGNRFVLNNLALQILEMNQPGCLKEIINKSISGLVFKSVSNQKLNDALKVVGELAEINKPVQQVKFIGGDMTRHSYKKYELLTAHIARKSFITISLHRKLHTEGIMKIAGISQPATIKRYMKVSDTFADKEMEKWN